MTKTLSRPKAIASIDSAHRCELKSGRLCVDANKRRFREELYPGKTQVARINHYQCRSFTNWMRKPERGEAGAFADDAPNAWRFNDEGCLRQFVSQVAVNRNEYVDTSMWRHVEPVKQYLHRLRIEGGARDAPARSLAVNAKTRARTSETRTARLQDETGVRSLGRAFTNRSAWSQRGVPATPSEAGTLYRAAPPRWWPLRGRLNRAMEKANAASQARDWAEAVSRWRGIIDEFGDKAPMRRRLPRARAGPSIPLTPNSPLRASKLPLSTRTPRRLVKACMALVRAGDCDRAIRVVQDLKRREGDSKLLLAIEGVAYLRAAQSELARRHWNNYWQRAIEDEHFATQARPKPAASKRPSRDFFPTLTRTGEDVAGPADARFCVYTALFGEYDDLRAPVFAPPGLEFICFSDRERDVAGWDVRIVDLELDIPALKNRKLKILPYDYLKGYDCSLYIDASIVFLTDPLIVYRRWLKDRPFVAWAHPQRSGVFEEIEAILTGLYHPPDPLLDQYAYFRDQAMPEQSGLIEASFLWRDHRDARVRDLMEQWWDFLVRFGGHRDQPALGYLMWKTGVRPSLLPDSLGTSRNSEFFCRLLHLQTAVELARDPERRAKGDTARDIAPARGARKPLGRPPRLTWVRRDRFKTVASTRMRGHQLSELARLRLAEAEVNYVDEYGVGAQSDSMLILTKGFLKEACLDELAQLKERGNILCGDYVDDPVREELHEYLDVYLAASIAQFIHYSKRYADKLVHFITHPCDPRLDGIRGPQDYCNIGYFGEIVNAHHARKLQGIIDFTLTNTQVSDAGWIPKLRYCNVHYAVRAPGSAKVFKPFLKGFTAAQCHSNIIVPSDESDARYYLGSDYPYLLKDAEFESVLDMIRYVKESFGSTEWRRGLEAMESVRQRCDATQIEGEIKALVAQCRSR
jgi:hypothetical protein